MVHKEGLCLSYLLLACSIIISSGFAYWLYKDTNMEKLRDYNYEYDRLNIYERYEDVPRLRSRILRSIFDNKIDKIWLPVIMDEPDGYFKLQLYSRLLAGNPDRKATYKEITAIIDAAPEEFQTGEKPRYLSGLKAIKGVHDDLLEKYDLLTIPD